jgi:hypothetical protein
VTEAVLVCLVACHSAPAIHFAEFAKGLTKDGYEVQVYASGPAIQKFWDQKINVTWEFCADNLSQEGQRELAEQIAQKCSKASVVITDIAHPWNIDLHKSLKEKAPTALSKAYYDNYAPYVSPEYSPVAAEVMSLAEEVLFANANLAKQPIYREPKSEVELDFSKRVGIGYYPMSQAEKIKQRRKEERHVMRQKFFASSGLEDTGQKLLVYFCASGKVFLNRLSQHFSKYLPQQKVRLISQTSSSLCSSILAQKLKMSVNS